MNEGCDSAKILMDAELEQGERQMGFTYSLWEDFGLTLGFSPSAVGKH